MIGYGAEFSVGTGTDIGTFKTGMPVDIPAERHAVVPE